MPLVGDRAARSRQKSYIFMYYYYYYFHFIGYHKIKTKQHAAVLTTKLADFQFTAHQDMLHNTFTYTVSLLIKILQASCFNIINNTSRSVSALD
jgi:hypothetical protein